MIENIIKTIEIEIGGVMVKVTPTEAKSLLDALSELLNVQPKVKIVEVEKWQPCQPYQPNQPYWTYPVTTIVSPNDKWTINYSLVNSTASLKV